MPGVDHIYMSLLLVYEAIVNRNLVVVVGTIVSQDQVVGVGNQIKAVLREAPHQGLHDVRQRDERPLVDDGLCNLVGVFMCLTGCLGPLQLLFLVDLDLHEVVLLQLFVVVVPADHDLLPIERDPEGVRCQSDILEYSVRTGPRTSIASEEEV